jgi:hypothetical protein
VETPQLVVLNLILLLLVFVVNVKAHAVLVPDKSEAVRVDRAQGSCGRCLTSSARYLDRQNTEVCKAPRLGNWR